jgi:PIN domain nuclease of toxin-antitoxin system
VRYLLDTCAYLWFAEGNVQLPAHIRALFEDPANNFLVSAISLWELSMKSVVGKLQPEWSPDDLSELATRNGISVLPVTVSQITAFHRLRPIHRDPFDRLLVAIAIDTGCQFISPEKSLEPLGIKCIW